MKKYNIYQAGHKVNEVIASSLEEAQAMALDYADMGVSESDSYFSLSTWAWRQK